MTEAGAMPGRFPLATSAAEVLRMVKIEHSLFALPFALLGMLLAARGLPQAMTILWICVCMVTARAAAMTCNRIVDREFDGRNPRTRDRALPAGRLSPRFAWGFLVVMSALFVLSAGLLNRLCLLLSPVALVVILGYSVTKRFTSFTHLVLGAALSIAPAGAWIAVRGDLTWEPVLLSLAVLFWVAGFDVLYSCQDVEADRREGLHSLAVRLGIPGALWVSGALHVAMIAALAALALVSPLGGTFGCGVAIAAAVLGYAHGIVRPGDLSRIQTAFFTTNVTVGFVLLAATWIDLAVSGV